MCSTIAYTKNRSIVLPEVRIENDHHTHVYVPLRGYAFQLAVFDHNDVCIGWIQTTTLGYTSVAEWIRETRWVDGGY